MKLKPYPKYKDSGVEWLGDVPEEWGVKKLKYATENLDNIRVPLSAEERGQVEGSYPYYGATGIIGYVSDYLFDGEYLLIGEDGAPFFLENEDVAFTAKGKFWVNNHAHILKTYENSDIRFVMHSLNCVDYKEYITGSTRDKLTQSDLSCIVIPLPPLPEQQAIVNFLDQKTTKIDELIKKNGKLIELLKEKRQAIISHAVTKGLDPNAKMRDSGIEWMGEVPEGCEVRKLKYLTTEKFKNGIFKKKEFYGSGIKLINVFDVYRQDFYIEIESLDRVEVTSQEVQTYSVKAGDIVFVRSSLKLEGVGASACVPSLSEPLLFECHLVKLQPSSKIIPEYLINFLNSSIVRQRLIALANTVTMATLGQSALTNIEVELPPIFEQQAILKYLKNETAKIDELIKKIQSQIEKLKEYRQTLISNVVTGKVRVDES